MSARILSGAHLVGRPRIVTDKLEAKVIAFLFKTTLQKGKMPEDCTARKQFGLSERSFRSIRLKHGLDRWTIRKLLTESAEKSDTQGSRSAITFARTKEAEDNCISLGYTPFGGAWLLIPLILSSAIVKAVSLLRMPKGIQVTAWQFVLTILWWSMLGFSRFFHLDDFRSKSDLGLALLTGRIKLLADSTLWRVLHSLPKESIEAFYEATSISTIEPSDPDSATNISLDDHVVPSFTELDPRPLGKTRVPTRGRSYPAVRLYYYYDLIKQKFIALQVKLASERLSKVLPDLIAHIKDLRKKAGCLANKLRLLFDRGGYKGSLFASLMEDDDLIFVTPAVRYASNVAQWEVIPNEEFLDYVPKEMEQLPQEKRPILKLADTTTIVTDCKQPIRSIVLRNDTPGTKQKWWVLFTNDTKSSAEAILEEYPLRQSHENAYRVLKHGHNGDALPKAYRLFRIENQQGEKRRTISTEVEQKDLWFVAWLKGLAINLIQDFGAALGRPFSRMTSPTLVRKFIRRPAYLTLVGNQLHVSLDPFEGYTFLSDWIQQINHQQLQIPWLGNLVLQISIAEKPALLPHNLAKIKRRIFANSASRKAA
jgi:hypothetical protein